MTASQPSSRGFKLGVAGVTIYASNGCAKRGLGFGALARFSGPSLARKASRLTPGSLIRPRPEFGFVAWRSHGCSGNGPVVPFRVFGRGGVEPLVGERV